MILLKIIFAVLLFVYEKYTWCHVEVYYPFFAILYIKSVVSEYQFCILVNKMKWILQPDSVLKTFFVFSQYLILCYISFSFIGDLDLILYLCCIWIMCLFGIYMGLAVGLIYLVFYSSTEHVSQRSATAVICIASNVTNDLQGLFP